MRRYILLLLFFIATSFTLAQAQYVFDYNSNCVKAYKQLMALQNTDANTTLQAELAKNPNNVIPIYLSDYADCLTLLFNGKASDYEKLKGNMNNRIEAIENADEKSPWYLFCKANIYLHWGLVNARFGDNFKAALKFRKSFLLLQENASLFPNFEENKVLLGMEQAVAGTVPENYKWISSLFGIKGNISKGINQLANYLNTHPHGDAAMQEEAMIYYAYLKFYLQSAPETAWTYLNGAQFNESNNLMRSFIKANIALNYRKADVAFSILNKIKSQPGFEQYPMMNYELAEAMIMRLDYNCIPFYEKFLAQYSSNYFVKDAWLKMAWVAYLKDDKTRTNYCIAQIKTKGATLTDADKQALRFAENPTWTSRTLLEVKLLIDGGFYASALAKIQAIDKTQLGSSLNVMDYNFRFGRIFEELKNNEKALLFYDATIQMGRNKKDYYAARASLQKAFIYERLGKKQEAIVQFKDCLSMRNHDFQSSIDQLAKAGLNRLGQ